MRTRRAQGGRAVPARTIPQKRSPLVSSVTEEFHGPPLGVQSAHVRQHGLGEPLPGGGFPRAFPMEATGWAEHRRLLNRNKANVRYYLHPPFLPRSMCELVPVGTTHVRLVDGQEAPYTTATEGLLVWVRLMQLGLQRGAVQHET